jgi:hypothetical protein
MKLALITDDDKTIVLAEGVEEVDLMSQEELDGLFQRVSQGIIDISQGSGHVQMSVPDYRLIRASGVERGNDEPGTA